MWVWVGECTYAYINMRCERYQGVLRESREETWTLIICDLHITGEVHWNITQDL